MRRAVLASVLAWVLAFAGARADDLRLTGDQYWIALASRGSAEAAIGLARRFAALRPVVVRTASGWFAVVTGPRVVARGRERTVLEELVRSSGIPAESHLSHGEDYASVVWRAPPSPVLASIHYDGTTDATLDAGPLHVVVSRKPAADGGFVPVATGTLDGKPAFTMAADSDDPVEAPAADLSLVRLDPASPEPQVVLTFFWQGAHCCTVTRIASEAADGHWAIVQGETLDGAGGYGFADLTGTGEADLTSTDQSFLYAFASYAGSVAPSRIHRLVGDRLVDVTREPRFYEVLRQDLAALEDGLKPSDPAWHDNGFLAGWVAEKMLVGEGKDAWGRMLEGYDHDPAFGPERCTADVPLDRCPEAKRVRIDFPTALKALLIARGYILDPALYPVPSQATTTKPTPAVAGSIRPALQDCVDESDSARQLIYQAVVGRRRQPNESYAAVTLEPDTTLEAHDPAIGRIVCAVTYDVDLRQLAAQLASEGDAARADAIRNLMRQTGPTSSTRIKYSIKPTATPGRNYIELLP